MSDPRLKEAMAEIMGTLQKFDIAGQVTLVSKTHAEFRFRIDPSWSVAKLEDQGGGKYGIRFRSTKSDIPDKEVRRELAELTIHLLAQIRDLSGANFVAFESILAQLKEHIDFEHTPGSGFEPHQEN